MANGKKNKQNTSGGRATPRNRKRAQARANRRGINTAGTLRKRMVSPLHMARRVFNAFDSSHLPLPTPQAPHLMVTTRTTFSTNDRYMLLGAMQASFDAGVPDMRTCWSNSVAFVENDSAGSIGANAVTRYSVPMPTTDMDDFEMVPGSISFQVFSVDSLTDAGGAVFIGRCKNILQTPKRSETMTTYEYFQNLVSFTAPKTLSGAELAMRPQQCNLLPGHHGEITNFEQGNLAPAQSSFVWGTESDTTYTAGEHLRFAAFKPGFIYNPQNKNLQVTVAVQWRLRLAPTNPLHSSQTHYAPTPPTVWHQITAAAESLGHGVEDVAEAAAVGAAGYLASGGFERGLESLTGYAMRTAGAALSGLEWAAPRLALAAL